ncbi:hypothetical protein F5Y16DRAFT_22746 [Xylariaceae sp. FL0255]|nr:hypothetical protein F5Y16DRAFT_22746 [Xylariaceae sp. FL0255]
MDHDFEIDLKKFRLHMSNGDFRYTLSVTSSAFVSNIPPWTHVTTENLDDLIKSKQLWLLRRGPCRLDMHVDLDTFSLLGGSTHEFLKFLADSVCNYSFWSVLGLTAEVIDILHTEGDLTSPQLYFNVKSADMCSALLSPPHSPIAHFQGVDCVLRFKTSTLSSSRGQDIAQNSSDIPGPSNKIANPRTSDFEDDAGENGDFVAQCEAACYLVEASLCYIVGIRKRFEGLRVQYKTSQMSLLELAPAVWNTQYIKLTETHTRNFTVISDILATWSLDQSSDLLRALAVFRDGDSTDQDTSQDQQALSARNFFQQKLWDLLRATLKPKVGTAKPNDNNLLTSESDCREEEVVLGSINGSMDEESSYFQYVRQFDTEYTEEDMDLWQDRNYDTNNISYLPDFDFTDQGDIEPSILSDGEMGFPEEEDIDSYERGLYFTFQEYPELDIEEQDERGKTEDEIYDPEYEERYLRDNPN